MKSTDITFIQIARRALAFKTKRYSLIDSINAIIEMEDFSISSCERAEMQLSKAIGKIYRNFDVTKITDSNQELIEFFSIKVYQSKIETLITIGDIDHEDGVINHIK